MIFRCSRRRRWRKNSRTFQAAVEAATDHEIAARCNVELELGKVLLPNFPNPTEKPRMAIFANSSRNGSRKNSRPKRRHRNVNDRLEYEIGVIEKTGFADYFLIVQDLIHWAKIAWHRRRSRPRLGRRKPGFLCSRHHGHQSPHLRLAL